MHRGLPWRVNRAANRDPDVVGIGVAADGAGRVEAMYRLSPSNDSIGQPSACALLRAVSATAVPHSPKSRALAAVGVAINAASEEAISHRLSLRGRDNWNVGISGPSVWPQPIGGAVIT